MFELMLNSVGRGGGSVNWCPDFDTGPGPQCMQYDPDDNTGFFGEVSSGEFINGQDLASLSGLTAGNLQNSSVNWLKFYIDGRILYTPRLGLRNIVKKRDFIENDMVEGNKHIIIKDYTFAVTLWSALNPGYNDVITEGIDLPFTHESDWNRLMYRICGSETHPSIRGDKWANYDTSHGTNGLGLDANSTTGYIIACKEADPKDPDRSIEHRRISKTAIANVRSNSIITGNNNWSWRPVLELVQ